MRRRFVDKETEILNRRRARGQRRDVDLMEMNVLAGSYFLKLLIYDAVGRGWGTFL